MPTITMHFSIDQSPEVAWQSLKDIALVADCMPGVELTAQTGPETFTGRLQARVGAISSFFEGEARIAERNDANRTGRIEAKGVDRKGGSRASATVSYTVSGRLQQAIIDVSADIRLQGTLAQFGRSGLLQDISGQLVEEFANTLRGRLAAAPGMAPVRAGAVNPLQLLLLAFWRRLRRLFPLSVRNRRGRYSTADRQ